MNHVGAYVTNETGEKEDLFFSNTNEVYGDYNSDDLFRSAISFFEGNKTIALNTFDSSMRSRYAFSDPMRPTDEETLSLLGVPFVNEDLKKKVESDFKNLYGVELNKENVEFAYWNTTYMGKGFNGEQEKVPRPLFKYTGEFDNENMHLLAFTLCRAVECKAMNKSLQSGSNSDSFGDTGYKFETFEPKSTPVFFQAPGKEPVAFDEEGMNKPKEPVAPVKHTVPKPKWYHKFAANFLSFTSAGKRAKEAINRYNIAEKKYDVEEKQYDSDKKKMDKWERSFSAASENAYNEDKQAFETYYEKQHKRSGENSFTKSSVKEININDVKTNGHDISKKEQIDYTALRNATNTNTNVKEEKKGMVHNS